jgi:hypothetical protein
MATSIPLSVTPYKRKWTPSVGSDREPVHMRQRYVVPWSSHAASRAFPIFAAAAPLAPAESMLPGSFFAVNSVEPGTECTQGKLNISRPQGWATRGVQNCAGRKGAFRRPRGDCVMAVAEFLMVDPKVLILIGAFLVALAAFGLSNRFGR